MGVFGQLGLLVKKNALLRKRHPGILLLEVLWPILIVAIVAVIRAAVPPVEKEICYYKDRAMPSSGIVPFLQSFVCNLDNKCYTKESRQVAEETAGSVSALVQELTPLVTSNDTLDVLAAVDDGMRLMATFSDVVTDDALISVINNSTRLETFFRDPEKVKVLLVRDFSWTSEAADALLASQINLTALLEITGYPDLKEVFCDANRLGHFLIFPSGTNGSGISQAWCNISDSRISEITTVMLQQINVAQIVRLLSLFESLKDRLNIPYTYAQGLNDVADMIDLIFSMENLKQSILQLTALTELPDIIRRIPHWVEQLSQSGATFDPLQELIQSLDPLVSRFLPNNTVWNTVMDGLALASRFSDLVTGNKNETAAHFMTSLTSFLQEVQNMFNNTSPEILAMLDVLSKVDWPRMWDLLSSVSSNETSVVLLVEQFFCRTIILKDVLAHVTSLQGDLNFTSVSLSSLLFLVGSCEGIHKTYISAVNSVCHTALIGLAFLALSSAVVGLTTVLIIFCSAFSWPYFGRRSRGYARVDDTDPFLPGLPPYEGYGSIRRVDSFQPITPSQQFVVNNGDRQSMRDLAAGESLPSTYQSGHYIQQYHNLAPGPRSIRQPEESEF